MDVAAMTHGDASAIWCKIVRGAPAAAKLAARCRVASSPLILNVTGSLSIIASC